MSGCELFESPDVELYFYGELNDADRARVEAHLRRCDGCRQRLDDLGAISRALADRPVVDAPPAGDWSGFMRRLDAEVGVHTRAATPAAQRSSSRSGYSAYSVAVSVAAVAAILAVIALGLYVAMRARDRASVPQTTAAAVNAPSRTMPAAPRPWDASLRQNSAEHLERSKLVVLGLAALDPKDTRAADWQYERRLAGTLLDDTRLYKQAAQARGLNDVAHVMRDLETVLIETSMSDTSDRDALARVQRLIAKRDLVVKMQLVSSN